MCVNCPDHGAGSGTANAKATLATIAAVVMAIAFYRIMVIAWPALLALWLVGCALAYAPDATRTALVWTWRGIRWVVLRRWRRPAIAPGMPYTATLSVTDGGRTRVLTSGEVPGLWGSRDEVETAVLRLAADRYGVPITALSCTATPVPAIAKEVQRWQA
jgi:hypothetical protein